MNVTPMSAQPETSDVGPPMLHRDRRDEKLWSLLPSKTATYDFMTLSKAETDALVEALGDGFGAVSNNNVAIPVPAHLKSGLLTHSFYVSELYDPDDADDVWNEEFWERGDEDQPAPGETFLYLCLCSEKQP
jgi:hypothetical protein